MTKIMPKWGWDESGVVKPYRFSEEDFERIASVLGVNKPSKNAREKLQRAVTDYLSNQWMAEIPRSMEVKAALEEIQEKSKALIYCLENIDSVSLQRLQVAALETETIGDSLFDPRIHENQGLFTVQQIYAATQKALEGLKLDKGGPRKTKGPLIGFILDLTPIFEKISGSRATRSTYNHSEGKYKGPFYNFIDMCLGIFDPKWGEHYLVEGIKKALNSRVKPAQKIA